MGMTQVNGYWWPEADKHCRAVIFDSVADMEPALALTTGRGIAVQAGGNCGVWANWLVERFDRVITFEPDADNFRCLERNIAANVEAHHAALGAGPGKTELSRIETNIGAHYLVPGNTIPVHCIDGHNLPGCDYLCLDIEGYELPALMGARETIRKFGPVIQIEDKGLSQKYGFDKGAAEKWLEPFGYVVRARIYRDVILSKETQNVR